VFDNFPTQRMNILLAEFNINICREDSVKPTIENESLHEISNDNGLKSSKFCHIEKYHSKKYNDS
jgi:hypothetical protein